MSIYDTCVDEIRVIESIKKKNTRFLNKPISYHSKSFAVKIIIMCTYKVYLLIVDTY